MNFFGQTKYNYIPVMLLPLVLLSASCGILATSEPKITKVTPLPTRVQSVEYGASLSEWEEATQVDTEQTANRDEMNTKAAETQETAMAVTVPTAAIASDEVTYPAEATEARPMEEPDTTNESTLVIFNDIAYQEIMWDGLVPADFTPDAIMAKYEEQLAQFEDGSKDALAVYQKMQEEFNNAPVKEALNETLVRLPGFIAPLEYTDDLITEFLLVPYFGACIHVPPPPSNQTVLVKTGEGYGISPEDAYNPVWVMGKLTTEGTTTALAEAGYYMQDAIIEPYTSP